MGCEKLPIRLRRPRAGASKRGSVKLEFVKQMTWSSKQYPETVYFSRAYRIRGENQNDQQIPVWRLREAGPAWRQRKITADSAIFGANEKHQAEMGFTHLRLTRLLEGYLCNINLNTHDISIRRRLRHFRSALYRTGTIHRIVAPHSEKQLAGGTLEPSQSKRTVLVLSVPEQGHYITILRSLHELGRSKILGIAPLMKNGRRERHIRQNPCTVHQRC